MKLPTSWTAAAITALMLVVPDTVRAADTVCGDVNASGGLNSTDALLALRVAVGQDVALDCPVPAIPLKTSQTACYDPAGNMVGCGSTRQDGELQLGVARDFSDNGNGTITDHATGLMWEKISDDGTIHDADLAYTWVQAFALKIAQLNAAAYGGHTDWRLPNRFELETLVNLAASDPATYSAFHTGCTGGCTVLTCSCTRPASYWSSTADHDPPSNAWHVIFNQGYTDAGSKTGTTRHVRGVRGGY